MPKNGAGGEMIIRTVKDRSHPYVMIHRRLFEDSRLSLEARGLMGYLLTKPDDWQVRVPDLQRTASVGRDQMRRILRELETAGYLVRQRSHGADGRWIWESLIHETPSELPSPENPSMVNPATDKPATDKPALDDPPMVEPSLGHPAADKPSIYQIVTIPIKESTNKESEDSNPRSPDGSRLGEPTIGSDLNYRPPHSPYIAAVLLDFSRELGDSVHGPANVTQALRLWSQSGRDEESFVAACQQARRTLRQAQSHGVANKMAYFFATLRRDLGLE